MPQKPHVPPIDVGQLRPLAEGLARRIARQHADVDDLVQVGLLACIVDHRRLTKRSRRAAPLTQRAAWALARTVLRRAMLGYYGTYTERTAEQAASLDDHETGAALARYAVSDSFQKQNDLLEVHDYLDALERACGAQARMIVQNLLEPAGRCAVRLAARIRRKQEKQREGYDRTHPRVRFSHQTVREAMGLQPRTWDERMEQIRSFTRDWLTKTA